MPGRTGQGGKADLAAIRQLEAAGLRAWPAAESHYDRTWAVRLTDGHPSRRLNSVNPLDPGDDHDLERRVAGVERLFVARGRVPTFRISPLCAPGISRFLDDRGWRTERRSLVMRADLDERAVADAMHQIPLKDRSRFIRATLKVRGYDKDMTAGLADVIAAIRPPTGLFVLEEARAPVATAVCVHDGALAGLFEIATEPKRRGRGYGRRVLLSALKWAYSHGARKAWLQVEADNEAAVGLYRSLGFATVYGYHYRRPPENGGGA